MTKVCIILTRDTGMAGSRNGRFHCPGARLCPHQAPLMALSTTPNCMPPTYLASFSHLYPPCSVAYTTCTPFSQQHWPAQYRWDCCCHGHEERHPCASPTCSSSPETLGNWGHRLWRTSSKHMRMGMQTGARGSVQVSISGSCQKAWALATALPHSMLMPALEMLA